MSRHDQDTSVLARQEPALRALLRIPGEQVLATMLPIGRPAREITKLRRVPVEEFTSRASADGEPFVRPQPGATG
jgi:hypothetical protein